MRLVHVGFREIDVICCHQRQVHRVSHLYMAALAEALGLRQAVLAGVALQLDIQPVGVGLRQLPQQRVGLGVLPVTQQPPHRAIRPARQTNQPFMMLCQLCQSDLRQLAFRVQIQTGDQLGSR